MFARWLSFISFVCFCLLGLAVLQISKRPLCIDSKVVERIDRLTEEKSETVFRCALNKSTPFNTYFNQQLNGLGYRVQQIERILEGMEPFERKIQIAIFQNHPYLFRVQGHQIYIGEKLLEAPGHLEKAIAKVWFRERSTGLIDHQDLMEEIITDFLVHLDDGDLDIGDPATNIKTALRKLKWPFAVLPLNAYCNSPWKISEHYSACRNKELMDSDFERQANSISIRPLLTAVWINSFKELSFQDRYYFIHAFPSLLKSAQSVKPQTSSGPQSEETVLFKASQAVKAINSYIAGIKAAKETSVIRNFATLFALELQAIGFKEAYVKGTFDILYVSSESIDESSAVFQQFIKMAEHNPQVQIAMRDPQNLWMLPIKYPINATAFGKIKANQTIVEKCGVYNFNFVLAYAETTDKLLIVEHCDKNQQVGYNRFLENGIEGFGAQNKTVTFVQFHLPSLLLRKSELEQVPSVFEFIQRRDIHNASFRSLGWQEIRWSKVADAYQPKAFVDAIEWFRVLN